MASRLPQEAATAFGALEKAAPFVAVRSDGGEALVCGTDAKDAVASAVQAAQDAQAAHKKE